MRSNSSLKPPGSGQKFERLHLWLRSFWPAPVAVNAQERLRVTLGVALGILLTGLLCHAMGVSGSGAWLVAPMGASAVLVFGVPSSPMAQPWPVVGGNTVSALAALACAQLVLPPEWATALAVGLAVGLMFMLRCLHPPAAGTALLVALSGVADPRFALFPVLANSLVLVLVGLAYNNATRKAYPHMQLPPNPAPPPNPTEDDLDAVVARYNQVLDISREDLKALLEDSRMQAYQRRLANTRCGDIMARELVTVTHSTPLETAWPLFRAHKIKALPVVDVDGRVIGIVTPADFMRSAQPAAGDSAAARLSQLDAHTRAAPAGPAPTVGQIMCRKVRVVSVERHLAELIPLFGSTGHHHIPVIGSHGRLVGMITQTDVVATLCKPNPEAGS